MSAAQVIPPRWDTSSPWRKPSIGDRLFHVHGEAVGTIWVIAHEHTRTFDGEDARVMSALGEFAAATYQALFGTLACAQRVERPGHAASSLKQER